MHHNAQLLSASLRKRKSYSVENLGATQFQYTQYQDPSCNIVNTISGLVPLKEPSDDMESPLLTLPPHQLWPVILINLKRLLRGKTS